MKWKKDLINIAQSASCAKGTRLDHYTKIGEYSRLNGGIFGRKLTIGSFTMLGSGIVAGYKVRIGDGVCIGDDVNLKNNEHVEDETAIQMKDGKRELLPAKPDRRYILKDGGCIRALA